MRRRLVTSRVEAPARLRCFTPADWLPLVRSGDYDPDAYRNRRNGEPYGEPVLSLEDWRNQQARAHWGRARRAWYVEHGWPGGLIDLLREERASRRAAAALGEM